MSIRTAPSTVLLALAGLLLLGAALAAWRRPGGGDPIPGFAWNRPPLSEVAYAALAARPGWSAASVPAAGAEGLRLRGLVRPPRAPAAPWLLFFQGNSTHLLAEAQPFLEAVAGEEDLGLAVVAYRGYDGSPGQPGAAALAADAVATLRWLEEGPARGGPVHLVSFSLGTLPALAAAAEAQAGGALRPPASLTLLAPYTALRMFEPGWLRSRLSAEVLDVRPLLARVQVPALVVHGAGDEVLPPAMGQAVQRGLGGPARLLELERAGHLDLLTDPRAHAAVRGAVLGGP